MDIKQEIITLLARARDGIRANMDAKKINASGRTSASLRIEEYDGGIRLVGGGEGAAPIPTLEIGHEGGNVPRGFYYIIKQWTRDKGLAFASESERSTFAYFLSRKIEREGTLRSKDPVDVYSSVTTEAVGKISDALRRYVSSEIASAVGRGGSVEGIKPNF